MVASGTAVHAYIIEKKEIEVSYKNTLEQEERIKQLGYKVFSVWEREKLEVCE